MTAVDPSSTTGELDPDERCPVCRWGVGGEAACGVCGWSGSDPVVAARHHDLRALARATDEPGDLVVRARLLRLCRGVAGLSTDAIDADVAAATADVDRADAPWRGRRLVGALEHAVERVAQRRGRRVVVIEIRPDVLTTASVEHDRGRARPGPSAVVDEPFRPLVGAPGPRARYLLAGGGLDGGAAPPPVAELDRIVDELCRRAGLPGESGATDLVVLRSRPGWLVLDLLAERLRARLRPLLDVARGEREQRPEELVRALCTGVPLPRSPHLVLARVARDGGVRLVPVPLFAPGTRVRAAGPLERDVLVRSPLPRGGRVQLPLVDGTGTGDDDGWSVLSVAAVELPPGRARVRVQVPAPGVARVVAVTPVADDAAPPDIEAGDRGVLDDVPRTWSPPTDVDVVVLVETAGDAGTRLAFARRLLHELTVHDAADPGSVRVTVLGYGDHVADAREPAQHVRVTGPTTAVAALDALEALHVTAAHYDYGCALEDALHAAARLPLRDAVRSLVVVGARPPALARPSRVPGVQCPHQIYWRDAWEDLRAREVRCVAVVEPPPWMRDETSYAPVGPALETWRTLGNDGHHDLADDPLAAVRAAVLPDVTASVGSPLRLALDATPIPTRLEDRS